jgi:translocation protein SEC62
MLLTDGGKYAEKALLSEKYSKGGKRKTLSQEEAVDVLQNLVREGLVIRVERVAPKSRHLQPSNVQSYNAEDHFAWVYEGSQIWRLLMGSGVIGIVLAGVMFPLWPVQLRVGVWYLSVSLLGLMGVFFVMSIARMFIAMFTSLYYGNKTFWLFPNLFEDVGIIDSFKPTYSWEHKKPKKKAVEQVEEDNEKKE